MLWTRWWWTSSCGMAWDASVKHGAWISRIAACSCKHGSTARGGLLEKVKVPDPDERAGVGDTSYQEVLRRDTWGQPRAVRQGSTAGLLAHADSSLRVTPVLDGQGRVVGIRGERVDADGRRRQRDVDLFGRLLVERVPLVRELGTVNLETKYEWDGGNRLVGLEEADGAYTRFAYYDLRGLRTGTWRYASKALATVLSPVSFETAEYDRDGKTTLQSDALGVTRYEMMK